MKQDKNKLKIKKLRDTVKRLNELSDILFNLPTEKLKKKIFAGHWRFYIVRKDIMKSTLGNQLQQVLDVCNSWKLGHKKDPKSYNYYDWDADYIFLGYVEGQYLKSLNQEQWDKANFPKFFEKKFFKVKSNTRSFGTKNVVHKTYIPNIPRWMFEFKYKPAYYEDKPVIPGDVMGEYTKLQDFMTQNNGWWVLNGANNDAWDISFDKKQMIDKVNKKELREELAEL